MTIIALLVAWYAVVGAFVLAFSHPNPKPLIKQ